MSHNLVRTSPFYTSPFCRIPVYAFPDWCFVKGNEHSRRKRDSKGRKVMRVMSTLLEAVRPRWGGITAMTIQNRGKNRDVQICDVHDCDVRCNVVVQSQPNPFGFLRVARLQNEVGMKSFFRGATFHDEKKIPRNFSRNFEPSLCGSVKSHKIPAKLPAKCPCQNKNSLTSFCRSAGRTLPPEQKKPIASRFCVQVGKLGTPPSSKDLKNQVPRRTHKAKVHTNTSKDLLEHFLKQGVLSQIA